MIHSNNWSFHWTAAVDDVDIRSEGFSGTGAVMIEIPPLAGHAIRNGGKAELCLIGFSDVPYDVRLPDSHRRRLVEFPVLSPLPV